MEAVLKDKRFAHVAKDPRFRRMPKGDRKVKIDKRFKDMFKDKKFKLKYTVDSRGRPVNLSTNENLKKFYELTDSEDSGEDGETPELTDNQDLIDKRIQQSDSESSSEDETGSEKDLSDKISDSESTEEEEEETRKKVKKTGNKVIKQTNLVKKNEKRKKATNSEGQKVDSTEIKKTDGIKKKQNTKKEILVKESKVLNKEIDFARGEGVMDSSSSDDEDSDDENDDSDEDSTDFDHKWNEHDKDIVEVSEASKRLALCNMDWDRIKAKDIFFILTSFKPVQGLIKSVKIYPSEFGKERMDQERLEGPIELKEMKGPDNEEEKDLDKEGSKFQTEKLRQYQLLRLKYYYAVVECDSVETADHIYKECDGKEYESSSTKVDLRFIPDDMEFEDEPSSMCTDVPVGYKPNFFFNTALSQSKVDLTWDETDRDRTQKIAKQFEPTPEDWEEDDLNAYLASSSDEEGVDYSKIVQQSDSESEEEEENEEKQISKYKQLLQEIDQEEQKKKDLDVQMEITWEPGLKEATEEIVKRKKETKSQTPWEDYLQRKKEKKRQRQIEKKVHRIQQQQASEPTELEEEEEEESDTHIGDDAFSDDDLPAGIEMDDPFFAEEMKTKGKSKKVDKKKKKLKKPKSQETEEDLKEKEALSLLVMGEEDNKRHFSLKKLVDPDKKKKKKKNKDKTENSIAKKEDDFQINVEDPRFSAMYDSHLFNIDPSAPEFRKTKGTDALVQEKLKRRKKKGSTLQQNSDKNNSNAKKRKLDETGTQRDESLASLVNSVKMKTKSFKSSKSKT